MSPGKKPGTEPAIHVVVEIQGMAAGCKCKHENDEGISYRTYHGITAKGNLGKTDVVDAFGRYVPENNTGVLQCGQGMAIYGHTLGKLEAPCRTLIVPCLGRARAAVRVVTRRLEKKCEWLLGFRLRLVLRRLGGLRRARMRRSIGGRDNTRRAWYPLLRE